MKELYFTYKNRKTIRALRIQYGQSDGKYVLKTFEGEESTSGLFLHKYIFPREEFFEDEHELLKKVSETKKGLMESRWVVKNIESVSNSSFMKTKIIDGEVSVEFYGEQDDAEYSP